MSESVTGDEISKGAHRSIHDAGPICNVLIIGYDVDVWYRFLLKVGQLLLSKVRSVARLDTQSG